MNSFEASVIIPVYNKWELTRKCLKSLATTTDTSKVEIIVVDNASTDATEKGCYFLGEKLFGDSFRYIRNNENRNFAGASNQGAEAARGTFCLFLNNDTEVQENWYAPLVQDFTDYPDIAATGSVLVYPEITPLGRLVQHLGIFISPFYFLGHLHEGIPYASPFARKRRFFQAITGACFMIRRDLFLDIGEFDEKFINGFEDVDLCLRLGIRGYRITVNPNSLVIHYKSQSDGRHIHEQENSEYFEKKNLGIMKPDWHLQLKEDGLSINVEWGRVNCMMPKEKIEELNIQIPSMDEKKLKETIIENPYWENGWCELLHRTTDDSEQYILLNTYLKLFSKPEQISMLLRVPWVSNNKSFLSLCAKYLHTFSTEPEQYLETAREALKFCISRGMYEVAEQFINFIKGYDNFCKTDFTGFIEELKHIELLCDS